MGNTSGTGPEQATIQRVAEVGQQSSAVRTELPKKLNFLFETHPYKIAYGGRGGCKSWGFARALLIKGAQQKLRILCARETQKSLKDSVHQLLEEQIKALGLAPFYRVEKAVIYGVNGTEILFSGLKHHVDNLKSMEAINLCWVEEAQGVSKTSWDKLIPTLFRVPNCELWVTFNPDLESDDTYQRFVVNPPETAVVVKMTYRDNPWFPPGLKRELEEAKRRNIDEFNHIWEGACINTLANAIYANELRAVDVEGRIRRVPYDPTRPVDTAWDLGFGDMVSIWMWQGFPMEIRLIDYEEGVRQPIHYYIAELQRRGYVWGIDHLPWDGGLGQLGSGKSIAELMRAAGRKVRVAPRLPVTDGINAVRTILPMCYFDEQRCSAGLRALRMYRYGEMQSYEGPTREPLHDIYSHPADAFRTLAVSIRQPQREREREQQKQRSYVSPWT
jgi:phage terminase large subunit